PSGPDVSLFPVKPTNPGLNCLTFFVPVSMSSTALLLRSPKKYLPRTGSTQLMSNDTSGLPGIVTVVFGANTSSGDAQLETASNAATEAAEDASFNVLLSKRRDGVHMRNLPDC